MQHSVIYNYIYNIYDFYYQFLQSQIKKELLNAIQSVLHCVLYLLCNIFTFCILITPKLPVGLISPITEHLRKLGAMLL